MKTTNNVGKELKSFEWSKWAIVMVLIWQDNQCFCIQWSLMLWLDDRKKRHLILILSRKVWRCGFVSSYLFFLFQNTSPRRWTDISLKEYSMQRNRIQETTQVLMIKKSLAFFLSDLDDIWKRFDVENSVRSFWLSSLLPFDSEDKTTNCTHARRRCSRLYDGSSKNFLWNSICSSTSERFEVLRWNHRCFRWIWMKRAILDGNDHYQFNRGHQK